MLHIIPRLSIYIFAYFFYFVGVIHLVTVSYLIVEYFTIVLYHCQGELLLQNRSLSIIRFIMEIRISIKLKCIWHITHIMAPLSPIWIHVDSA